MPKSISRLVCMTIWLSIALQQMPSSAASAHKEPSAQRTTDHPSTRSVTLVSSEQPAGTVDASLANEVNAAINRALDWMAEHQKQDGSWSNASFPALTALSLQGFISGTHVHRDKVVKRATSFIVSCVHKDGGIYVTVPGRKGGGLSNYNTAICMTALHATGDAAFVKIVQDARRFIAGAQHSGDDIYNGGFGYDRNTKRAYTDLLNTYYAVQSMRVTQDVEDLRPSTEKRVDINWSETVKFIERMQNKPDAGKADAGGFFYNPTSEKAGTVTNETGAVVFRSYGSMTYAGLLALIYANVSRDDVRVRSAFKWAADHWSLDENPGMGGQGLFFFYNVLTRSLNACGTDTIPHNDGTHINWRRQLAKKLVTIQKIDPVTGHGYWINDTGRFWESDPVLATAYSILALQTTIRGKQRKSR